MRKLCVFAVVVLLGLTAVPSAAAAGVGDLSFCVGAGGSVTVPAGTVIVQETWADTSPALVRRFVRIQNTTASVDGVPVSDASSLWGPVTQAGSLFVTSWSYNAGALASPGDALTVVYDITFTRRFRDGNGTVYRRGSSVYGGPITCTFVAT